MLLAFILAIGNVWGADYLINVESGNLSTDSKWYQIASVGGVTNKTGSTWSSADITCSPAGAKIGSSNFTVRTDLANTTQITVVASSGSNRTISSVKTGTSVSSLSDATGCTKSGSVAKNTCDQVLTFTFNPALSAGTYVNIAMSGNMNVHSVTITAGAATKHTVTYDLNGGTGTTPTQADVAEGAKFTLHNGTTDITAPAGKKFDGWHDGTTKYAGGAEYTMGTSNVTLTAQWVEDLPDPTASFADATYIIGQSALDMSAKFTSNSSGSVTYSLKEATSNASITTAGSFTATVAGTYVIVASQEAVAGTYAAISKEATVTVLDSEVADIYIWKKGTGYTGCVASPNADALAAQYTDIAYEGFTGMGRAAADNTECILTFTVKAAYSATFGIKSICTYGKLEEPAGGQISWDGGTNWEDLAAYAEGKKEFTAPAATFPTSFKIRFLGVSASSGGLYWRNALVTLEVKKTVSSVTETLTNVKVNDVAITSAELTTLLADKTLDIATSYATAPTVTFVKQVTTSYSGGWADDVASEEIEVAASDITTAWSASATLNAQTYTVTLAKPAGPSLETEATAFTLTSAKVATDTKTFTFSGVNLTSGNVTISLESSVAGLTVSPAEVTPTAGAITDQEVTITYKSLEAVAEANVNLVVYYDADTKITIPLTYSSTVGYEDLTPISAATTWNWDGAASAAVGTVVDKAQMIILANADVTWDEGFNARAIAGKLEYMCRDNKYAQGDELMFNTTIPGKVYVTYSNTGGNAARTVNVNGVKGSLSSSNTKDADKCTESFAVSAGDVLIKGVQVSDDAAKYLRYYEVRFVPVFAVTYNAGDGAVKTGETMPTQADEAAGEKIILAAATALEKDGYDFAGWLCNIDAQTYQPGDEYEMTAAATTFTAKWVLHVDPVDPTLTYNEGAYMVGAAALDLSTLISASTSTGTITYSVKDAGTTGATITDGKFTATAAGTATITASQAAILGYNAITVDFEVVVTEATEIDGIKMVEAGALTGNFRIKADQLKTGDNTVEGINYTKYVQMSSTHTSFSGETEGVQTKGIYYAPTKKNIKFWFYMRNTDSSARKIYIYKMEEGSAVSSETVSVDAGSHLVSYDMTLSTNAEVIFGVENTKLCFCQIVAVESGDDLLKGGQNGYVFDYSKKRQNVAKETLRTIDGIDYYLYADSKINSSANVQLNTLGTHYIKFHLNSPMTVKVSIDGTKQYYIGTECSTDDAAKAFSATETAEFSLTAGDWYINAAVQVKVTKLEFIAPKCAEPEFNALANSDLCEGAAFEALDGTATVADAGTPIYQWYNADGDVELTGETNPTYTPTADGSYYVIATNQLAGYSDNSKKSDIVTVEHFASAVITTAPLNQRATAGNNVMLSVAATGKNVAYKWYTCDEDGSNELALEPEQTGTSIEVTITAGLLQWYKVKVTSDCGNAEAMAKVEEFVPATPANVTESIVWDWKSTTAGFPTENTSIDFTNTEVEELFADVDAAMPNNAEFRSDMLYGIGQRAWRKSNNDGECGFQGFQIRFNTEVAGCVRVYFRAPSSGQTSVVTINGRQAGSRGNSWGWSEYVDVEANTNVIIAMTNGETGMTRVQKIEFLAVGHERTLVVGDLGTVCLPNASIARGVTVYEYQGADEIGKIVFDELGANELLVAGKPYIFQVNETNARFYYNTASAVGTPDNTKALKGNLGATITFDPGSPAAENVYFVKDHAFWMAKNTGVKIGQYRCYLQMDEVQPVSSPNPAPGRRRITLGVQGEQVATGFENTGFESEAPRKVLINGELFILRGEKMYDAKGQLVK